MVWASATKSNVYRLLTLQKKFLRAVENVRMHYLTSDLFTKYNVPTTKCYGYRICKLCKEESKRADGLSQKIGKLKKM